MAKIEAILKPFRLSDVHGTLAGVGVKGMNIPYRVCADWLLADSWLRCLSGIAGIIWGICSFSG